MQESVQGARGPRACCACEALIRLIAHREWAMQYGFAKFPPDERASEQIHWGGRRDGHTGEKRCDKVKAVLFWL